MALTGLDISDFRNLGHIELPCSSDLNLLIGANASGKTSLLEAIYFLGRGRSFRTRQARELIRRGSGRFQLVGGLRRADSERRGVIGIAYDGRELTARIDAAPVRTLAELAVRVPVLLLNPDSHRLLEDGPRLRRRFLDWGVFHHEPAFLEAWKRYHGALRQRNSALRAGYDRRSLSPWDAELVRYACPLAEMRKHFCEALTAALRPLLGQLLGQVEVALDYQPGWPQGRDLTELLSLELDTDRRQGHTRRGPHRADFTVRLDDQPAELCLSRGQQKLLVTALIAAQARLYRARHEQSCILLIDDLPAELDPDNRQRVMTCLAGLDSQLFITAIEPDLLDSADWSAPRAHRLTDGRIEEVV